MFLNKVKMWKILCFLVIGWFCGFSQGIYNPADVSTKPPYTRKEWRSIALNPDELNNIQMHHNYSRVYIQNNRESKSQNEFNDQIQENSQIIEQQSTFDQQQQQNLEDFDQKQTVEEHETFGQIDQVTINDKLNFNPGINDKLDFPNQKYEASRGQSTYSQNIGEINVGKFHYPPRPYEVYPFTEMKPFSNMAFENCPKNVTGQLVYLWSCSQYLNCWKGRKHLQNCPPGTLFNPETLECDFSHKVDCISGPHNQKVQFEKYISSPTPGNEARRGKNLCPIGFSGLISHPSDCRKFINCANGQTFVQDCGPGTAFNSRIQACDWPHKVECESYTLTDQDLRGQNYRQASSCSSSNCPAPEQQQYHLRNPGPGQKCDPSQPGCNINVKLQTGFAVTDHDQNNCQGSNQQCGPLGFHCPLSNPDCQPGVDLNNYQKIYNISTQSWQYIPRNIGQPGSTPQSNQHQGFGQSYVISCPASNPNCQPGLDLNNYQKIFNITTQIWQYIPRNVGPNIGQPQGFGQTHGGTNCPSSNTNCQPRSESNNPQNIGPHDGQPGQQYWISGSTPQTNQNQGFGQTHSGTNCPSSNTNCQPGISSNNPQNIGPYNGQPGPQYWTSGSTPQTSQNQGFGQTHYIISCPASNPNCQPGIDSNNYQKIFNITTQTWQYIPKNVGPNVGQPGQFWSPGSTPQTNKNQGFGQTHGVTNCPSSNTNCQSGIDSNNHQNIGSNVGQPGQQYWTSGSTPQTNQNSGFGQTHYVISCPSSNPNCQPGIDLNNYQKIFNITTQTWQYIPKSVGPNVGQPGQYWTSEPTPQPNQNPGFGQTHYIISCPASNPNCQPGIDLNNYQKIFNITTQTWQFIPKNIGPNNGQQYWTHHQGPTEQQYAGSNQQNIGLSPPPPSGQGYGTTWSSRPIHHGNQQGSYDRSLNYQTGQTGSQNVGATKKEAKCPAGHSGLLPHPFICEKFLNCANGRTYVQDCGPGTVFNPKLKVCDWPYNVDCNTTTVDHQTGSSIGSPGSSYQPHQIGGSTNSYQSPGGTVHHQTGSSVYSQHVTSNPQPHPTGGSTNSYQTPGTVHYQTGSNIYSQHVASNPQAHPTGGSTNSYQTTGTVHHQAGSGIYSQHVTSNPQPHQIGGNTNSYQTPGTVHHQTGSGIYSQHVASNPQPHQIGGNTNSYQTDPTRAPGETVHHQTGSSIYTQQVASNPQGNYQPRGTYNQEHYQPGQPGQSGSTINSYQENLGGSSFPPIDQQVSGIQNYYTQPQNTTGRNYIGVIGHRRPNSNDCFGSQCVNSKLDFGPSNSPSSNLQQSHKNDSNIFYITPIPSRPVYQSTTPKHIYSKGGPTKKYHPSNVYVGPTPVPESPAGINKRPHAPAPFPSTDTNADYEFDTEEVTELPKISVSQQKPNQVWKNSGKCQDDEFTCKINECIPQTWKCDGNQDCSNGLDEANCGSYIKHFTKTPNARLYKHETEKWLNTDLETCANYCLNSKTFQCRSFNFRRDQNTCLMCDTNVGNSGALANSHLYDYYEMSRYSVNCSGMYECSNKKCINFSQVCDGNDNCGNRQDEKNCKAASIDYAIRLAGSEVPNEGRIEVKVFGEWGYVCDDRFGLRSADVVCKELGFPQGALEVKSGSYFAKTIKDNETYYLMDDVQCVGNESSIRNCDFSGWGVHNCMPQEIAGVVCKTEQQVCPADHWKCDTTNECLPLQFLCDDVRDCADHSDEGSQHCQAPIELRLANGANKLEGRVEIRYRGVWGTICDDDFNDNTAKVVCQSLGYRGSAVAKKDGAFGAGSGPIWLDEVHCFGNESFIDDCAHWRWGEHNCEHSEDAGVVCSNIDTSVYEKKSRAKNPPAAPTNPTDPTEDLFKGKCGHTGEDLFFEENNDNSDIQFRVVKGTTAKRGQYPWQATIRVKGKNIKSSHWCGAVVISNKFVLTAAHCLVGFSKGSYIVRAGDYNINEEEGSEVEAFIEDFFVHERFRQDGHMNNDIALVKLKGGGLRLSKQVQPICLPDTDTVYRSGLNCTISGFGSTESGKSTSSHVLRAGWVKIQADNVCKMEQVYGEAITKGMFCAGSLDEGVDSCDGDSGGPLACLDKGLYTLYGITSWGQRCGYANKPGVYVKIAHYRSWIDKKIEENS